MASYQKSISQGARGHPDALADVRNSCINSASSKARNDKVKSRLASLREPVSINRTHLVTVTTFSTQEKNSNRLNSSQTKLKRIPGTPNPERTRTMSRGFKPKKSVKMSTRSSSSSPSRGRPPASASSSENRCLNRRLVAPSHRQSAHDSPATVTPPSRDKPLPPKPVLRANDSPERRGIFDATDSASKSLNNQFPPLQPDSSPASANASQEPPSGESFNKTPSLLSTSSQFDAEIGVARVVRLQVVKGPKATRTSTLREQMHKNSSVLTARVINVPSSSKPTPGYPHSLDVSPIPSRTPRRSARFTTSEHTTPNFSRNCLTAGRGADVNASSSVGIIDTHARSQVLPRLASLKITQKGTGAICRVPVTPVTSSKAQSPVSSPGIVNDQSVFNALLQTHLDTSMNDTATAPLNISRNYAKKRSDLNESTSSSGNSKKGLHVIGSKGSSATNAKNSSSSTLKRSSVTFGNVGKGFKSLGKKVTTKFNASNVPRQTGDAQVGPETVDRHTIDRSRDKVEDDAAVRAARNRPAFRGAETEDIANNPRSMVLSDDGINYRARAEVEEFNRFLRYFTDVYGALVRSTQQIRDPQRRRAVMNEVQRAGQDLHLSREAHIESLQINQELMSTQARLARNMTRLARLASESDE